MEKKEHPQAKWLRAIADGKTLQDNNTPMGTYVDLCPDSALTRMANNCATNRWRIKPRTITIGKYEVAEPMRVAPKNGERYWFITAPQAAEVLKEHWYGTTFDKEVLKSGMCWLKREDAELAAKAITELLTGKAA